MLVLKLISNLYIYILIEKHFIYIIYMKNIYLNTRLLLLFLLIAINSFSQTFFKYKISKTYCVFNFMETSIGSHGTSKTLEKFIQDNTKNDNEFGKLCEEYKKINLYNQFKFDGFPEDRNNYGNSFDIISMNAVNSSNLEEFKQKNLGLITISDNEKLYEILKNAEKKYDKIIWRESDKKLISHLEELSKYEKSNASIFQKFNHFYDSSWTEKTPFNVVIYPIPGSKGNTTATPHINALCVSILTEDKDRVGINSVALHEMCHVLYQNQSKEVQSQLDNYFKENQSIYAKQAYTYFNEALATALGNGYAYKEMNGKIDESEWYDDETINGFAKAIYPLVEDYLQKNKTIDKEFIDKSIQLFSEKFPNSIYNYAQSLNKTIVYYDDFEGNELVNKMDKYFQISNINQSSPILHPYSIESITSSNDNQFFIIDSNQNETLKSLSQYFPEISKIKFETTPINISFIDNKKRTIIMLVLNNKYELDLELKKMKENQFFNLKQLIQQ